MRKKEKDFISRLQKVKLVGGHFDGLRPEWARRLYSSQLRPILEFGMVVIPFRDEHINRLEKLQNTALRQLFGLRLKTKKETIRILSGFPSMRCRIAQLVLGAHKKLEVIFDEDYYLNKILNYNAAFENGLKNDVQIILDSFANSDVDTHRLKTGYGVEIFHPKDLKGFKKDLRGLLEEIDFKNTKNA